MLRQLPYVLVVCATCGEFGIATALFIGHGEDAAFLFVNIVFGKMRDDGLIAQFQRQAADCRRLMDEFEP